MYVLGRIIAPGTRSEALSDQRFVRCPIAASPPRWVRRRVDTHRRLSSDALRPTVRIDDASAAMTQGLDVLDREVDSYRAMQIEETRRDAENEARARAAAAARGRS